MPDPSERLALSEESCGAAARPGVSTRRVISTDSPGRLCETPCTPPAAWQAGQGPLVPGWPVPDATISLYLQAEALRRAFPAWSIAVQPWAGDRARIEAVNTRGGGLYALISTDPAELWRELCASHAP
jgi:hypothetical protein